MATPEETRRPAGLRLHDLVGLVVGYGMAALLVRALWPRDRPIAGIPAVALACDFGWLGLAMSGPIVLLLDRRGPPRSTLDLESNRRGRVRPGRLISEPRPDDPPIGRGPVGAPTESTSTFSRAELAWMVIGGYWIALTLFVVPGHSIDTPWALVGLLQVVAAVGLWLVVPRQVRPGAPANSWTHGAAVALLWTWPIAWMFLIVLGKSS